MPEPLLAVADQDRVMAGAGAESAFCATHPALTAAIARGGQISWRPVDLKPATTCHIAEPHPVNDSYRISVRYLIGGWQIPENYHSDIR
jgi:hypothetical protein